MERRKLFGMLGAAALAPFATAFAKRPRAAGLGVLLQESPLAGFQYHHGAKVWPRLRAGDALELRREPNNRYDERAVAVYWRSRKLGYLPRRENFVAAQMLDRGQALAGKISALKQSDDPWERVSVGVYFEAG